LSLCDSGAVSDCSFAFFLDSKAGSSASELTLGGYDSAHAKGDFTYVALAAEDYWRIPVSGLTAGGK